MQRTQLDTHTMQLTALAESSPDEASAEVRSVELVWTNGNSQDAQLHPSIGHDMPHRVWRDTARFLQHADDLLLLSFK